MYIYFPEIDAVSSSYGGSGLHYEGDYWSSTNYSTTLAYCFDWVGAGYHNMRSKFDTKRVRAVREF